MWELTRDQFKAEFGKAPGALFDLTKILNTNHRIEAMRLPDPKLMRVRKEYGTLVAPGKPDIIYCLDVGYWIDDGRFKAVIEKVIIFDDQAEQDLHKAAAAAHAPNWNDN